RFSHHFAVAPAGKPDRGAAAPSRTDNQSSPEGTNSMTEPQPPTIAVCQHEPCCNLLPPPPRNGGKPRRYCSDRCAQRERLAKAREANPKPSPVGRWGKHEPGTKWAELKLLQYVESNPEGARRGLFECSCGTRKVIHLRNVSSGQI